MASPSQVTRAEFLKRQLEKLKERGWTYNVGPEPEFFLFRRNGSESIRPVPHDVGGYFDFSPNDDAVRVRTELMSALRTMGLDVEVGHHEVALGQHEIDFRFKDALVAADSVITLKYTVKAIAAQHGSDCFIYAQAHLWDQWFRYALPPILLRSGRQQPVL
jgi:glutamine synthetase